MTGRPNRGRAYVYLARHLLLRLGARMLICVGRQLGRQVAPLDATHVTRIQGPEESTRA